MMQSVELESTEWQQVITALAMSNPVLVKISTQLSQHQRELTHGNMAAQGNPPTLHPGNSKEPHHGL